MNKHLLKQSELELIALGQQLAQICAPLSEHLIIYLSGELGAGKTTLARAFIKNYGIKKVKSPTYSLVESYQTPHKLIHHFDCYRLNNAQELEEMGIRDYQGNQNTGTISLIEWANKAQGVIPAAHLSIELSNHNHSHLYRDIALTSHHTLGEVLLSKL